ncbi:hypothetical protein BDW27_110169 [Nocardiopsis sp. L17-MgMaSL7]|nr:hypothetical protein BDW27_110169 [Nocardiopsis sp. L17-MgMaSL7]
MIFKCASEPFTHEDEALIAARQAGVDVPLVLASTRGSTTLGMLLEDLGEPCCQAHDDDGGNCTPPLSPTFSRPETPIGWPHCPVGRCAP